MLHLPRNPTLFPYTTLFRSGDEVIPHPLATFTNAVTVHAVHFMMQRKQLEKERTRHSNDSSRTSSPPPDQDRKSTRLNSSHTVISYAVFCLKKKKKYK